MAKWIKLGRYHKILQDVMSAKKDDGIRFNELCALLEMLGCELNRVSDNHQIFSYDNVEEQLDFQTDGKKRSKATSSQVEQTREFIKKYMEV
ncbi:MAG: hypothetical protein J1E64_06080 [Acetatifactor sp.]|nr:hypothetical protein [Acetatifactor sp.]